MTQTELTDLWFDFLELIAAIQTLGHEPSLEEVF